jgi:hypothetical protein
MAEFYVNYDLVSTGFVGRTYTKRVRGEACYSGLFVEGNNPNNHKICSHYWLKEYASRELADRFIKEFVMTHLPKRIDPAAISYSTLEEVPCKFPYGDYWQTVEIDLSKVTATDLYMLLMLFRYPQENPEFAKTYFKILTEEKATPSWAFAKAHHRGVSVGFGHLVMHSNTPYVFIGDENYPDPGWNFVALWETLAVGNLPYKKKSNKIFGINDHFVIRLR